MSLLHIKQNNDIFATLKFLITIMKISYTWLKDFIDIDWPAEQTGNLLTDLGLEIEGIDRFESIKGGLEGVVVGQVLTCEKHPNADRLKITTVEVADGEILQIVCGAPNIAVGQKVPVATVGTTLYDPEKGPWKIKKGKIRGEESFGMICAEDELGIGEGHEGIMVLQSDLKPGLPLAEVFNVLTDEVFEIGLTPNRSDAMSHYGVARDLYAGLIREGNKKPLELPSVSKFRVDGHTRHIPVVVEDSERAPRYCGITMTSVEVKESPTWLKNRLKAIGLVPRNNIVDATNYVMHAIGQPFHAFDADRITGQKITVKTLEEGTKFITLDGVERTLSAEDLVICDEKKPLCIAGVYGGLHSGVTENTTSIFLESAYFDPVSVRKTAKRHGLNTDASFRFERGIDPNLCDYALRRLVLLIQELAGGNVSTDIDDFYPKKFQDFQVFLRYKKIDRLIGQKIEENELKTVLAALKIKVKNVTESGMGLEIPPFRADVQREIDVIEEVLRVYGYNRIHIKEKVNATIALTQKYDDYNVQNVAGNQLIGQGFYEIMNNSLTMADQVFDQDQSEANNIELLNPLSHDLATMRQSLLGGGLESIAFNINRKNVDLRFFEFGKTYHKVKGAYVEKKHLSLFVTGKQQKENWNSIDRKNGFFFMKGTLNALFERLGIEVSYQTLETTGNWFNEGLEIWNKKELIGSFGVLKSTIRRKYDVKQEVLFADLNWNCILENIAKKPKLKLRPIAKYPAIRRDFALLLGQEIGFDQIEKLAYQTEKHILKNVGLFDVYQGENLPEGKKSYAVSFTFRDDEKTLTDKYVDKIMKKLRFRFEKELQAELR